MPSLTQRGLFPRQSCDGYGYGYSSDCYYNSPWDSYGRWILLAAIVIGAFLLFFVFSCMTARRRRRANLRPYPLTGWAGGNQGGGYYGTQQQQYTQPAYPQQEYTGQNAPPAYGAANAGYYGNKGNTEPYGNLAGQQNGVELQEPQGSYQPQRGGTDVYEAPPGPPPGKGDGIIR